MNETIHKVKAAIIIVAYGNENSINNTLDAIAEDKKDLDKVILVDNHPKHQSAKIARLHKIVDYVVESENIGFGGGCNLGAEYAKNVDFIYFLNPDVVPLKNFLIELKKAYLEKPDWSAWMSLLLLPDSTVNSSGTAVHLSGLSWVLDYGAKKSKFVDPKELSFISGACFAIRKSVWDEIGGFTPEYFLYYEDTELATRLLLRNHKMGLWPKSQVVHDYDFNNTNNKWFYLERNRLIYMLTAWPLLVLLLLMPIIILCEMGLWAVSILQKRFLLRVKSVFSFIKFIPNIPSLRRKIQKNRTISSKEFIYALTSDLRNPFLGRVSEIKIITSFFNLYKDILLSILKIFTKHNNQSSSDKVSEL